VVLDILVNYHLLVRVGGDTASIAFQHQQFQEWYASFEVQRLMRASAAGEQSARRALRENVLNIRFWEEAILFACERISRNSLTESHVVAAVILETMTIDPLLAAEMIFRSTDTVWQAVRDRVLPFVLKWHDANKVDAAVHFMISSGRGEFSNEVWRLI